MLKVNVLGFWGTFPSAGGATSGYLISGNSGKILLDCGCGVMSRLPFYTNVESISAVFLTHLHFDHMCDVGILQYAANFALRNKKMKEKLKIYAPSGPEDILKTIKSVNSDVLIMSENNNVDVAGMKISFMHVNHPVPCFAVRIEQEGNVIVYITDTSYMDYIADFARDADLLICEASVSDESRHTSGKGHMNAFQAGLIAKDANAKNLLLTHLSHDCDLELLRKNASESFGHKVFMPHIKSVYTID